MTSKSQDKRMACLGGGYQPGTIAVSMSWEGQTVTGLLNRSWIEQTAREIESTPVPQWPWKTEPCVPDSGTGNFAPRGRRAPYTDTGIRRVPCARCGKPSRFQWSVCANGNRHQGCCAECDIELNRLALTFFRFDNIEERIAMYAADKGGWVAQDKTGL
jgi:hypothetical protein